VFVSALFLAVIGDPTASAQPLCEPHWLAAEWGGQRSTRSLGDESNNSVVALARLPNGDLVASLVDGGAFRWDGSSWSPFGSIAGGTPGIVIAAPNGDVVAYGTFTTDARLTFSGIERWNGSAWSSLASGSDIDGYVEALVLMPNGDLIAGGTFTRIGNVSARAIARWDGTAWSALGDGIGDQGVSDFVSALVVLSDGTLAVGGSFTTAGDAPANNVALWNGSAWSPLGSGVHETVLALAAGPGGEVYLGGTDATGFVARWDGSVWQTMPGYDDLDNAVLSLAVLPDGDVVAGGYNTLALWEGSAWSPLGDFSAGSGFSQLTALPNGDLIVSGGFEDDSFLNIARWRSSDNQWLPIGLGPDGTIYTLCVLPNGDLAAGGNFLCAENVVLNGVARWDGAAWSPVGQGMPTEDFIPLFGPDSVRTLVPVGDGGLMAAGRYDSFNSVWGSLDAFVWNGTSWQRPFGSAWSTPIESLTRLPNGDVIAGGFELFYNPNERRYFNVAHWDGSIWAPLAFGLDGGSGWVHAVATLPSGEVVAGGNFSQTEDPNGGSVAVLNIARWNGLRWSPLGSGVTHLDGSPASVYALLALPDGSTVAGGDFDTAGGVAASNLAVWDGLSWSSLGSGIDGTVTALAVRPSGELIAGGQFTTAGGAPANNIALWNGAAWSALGAGVGGGRVDALAVLSNGDLAVGGEFTSAGGLPSACFATYAFGSTMPTITAQPQPAAACAANPALFSLTASGSGSLTYQWQVQTAPDTWVTLGTDSVPLPCGGSARATLPGDAATGVSVTPCPGLNRYQVRCVVTDACGSATSDAALLTVNSADFDGDGHAGTDQDIQAFFACIAGNCCAACGSADFNGDGAVATDADIEAFFRVLAGGSC
jgi:hypothetical protein